MYFVNDWCMRNTCLSGIIQAGSFLSFTGLPLQYAYIWEDRSSSNTCSPKFRRTPKNGVICTNEVEWGLSWWQHLLSSFLPFCEIYYLLNEAWALLYTNASSQKISCFWNKMVLKVKLIYLGSQRVGWWGNLEDGKTAGCWRHIGK